MKCPIDVTEKEQVQCLDDNISPITALIVDDDPLSLSILEMLLISLEIKTVTAVDLASARYCLTQVVPQIAILDVMLPDGDGVDILREIRDAALPTAVAMVSATLEDFPFYKCHTIKPDIIFNKPLDSKVVYGWASAQAMTAQGRMDKFQLHRRLV